MLGFDKELGLKACQHFQLGTLNALSSSIKNVWSNLFSVSGTEEDDNDGKLRKRIGHGLVLESRKKLF